MRRSRGPSSSSVEEAGAAAEEDGRDVDLHLVEKARRQVLLGDVGAARDLDVLAARGVARSLERRLDAVGDELEAGLAELERLTLDGA